MKSISRNLFIQYKLNSGKVKNVLFFLLFACFAFQLNGQDEPAKKVKQKPVRDMFESTWLIDNQTVIVPTKGTFQMDIIHRFGTWKEGYKNLYGLFAPSNIKLGFSYSVIKNMAVGFGLTKERMTLDFHLKYAIFQQTRSGSFPVSISYFVNTAVDTRNGERFENSTDRFSYFHQILFARKFSPKLSLQIAPSFSHFNAVDAILSPENEVIALQENDHIAISYSGRYKISDQFSFIANYDLPLTSHYADGPDPNFGLGFESTTSSHAFQVFITNGKGIIPQRNNVFNNNGFGDGEILIGFNMTRIW